MQTIVEQIQAEVADAPVEIQREVLDFAKFLRVRRRDPSAGPATPAIDEHAQQLALAATAWNADWSDPDEEAAWANL